MRYDAHNWGVSLHDMLCSSVWLGVIIQHIGNKNLHDIGCKSRRLKVHMTKMTFAWYVLIIFVCVTSRGIPEWTHIWICPDRVIPEGNPEEIPERFPDEEAFMHYMLREFLKLFPGWFLEKLS